MPGRSCHCITLKHIQHSTLIDQVNYLRLIPAYCEHEQYSHSPEPENYFSSLQYKQYLGLFEFIFLYKFNAFNESVFNYKIFVANRKRPNTLIIGEVNTKGNWITLVGIPIVYYFKRKEIIFNNFKCLITSKLSHCGFYSDSCFLDNLRCRRLISPSRAVTTNCPVLSPFSFRLSIASTSGNGTRASILFDFAFTDFVAIVGFPAYWCPTIISKKNNNSILDVSHTTLLLCVPHLAFVRCNITKPGSVGALTGPLTTTLNEVTLWLTSSLPKLPQISVSLSRP
ncbi:hypothetical protein EGD00_20805 [Pectobacterium carotovorum subsp. carotovorum]|nr:hypothetical protein EGD00_20805 [Pectobacterium carotovorum subsp. carotovorum]